MSVTNFNNFSSEAIIQALKKLDLELTPFIVYVNPKDEQELTKALGDLKEQALIKSCNLIEAGKAYIALRRDIIEPDINPLNFTTEEV